MESETLEYKRELTDGFEKEVVAFLNMQGGQIVIGKADDGTICPLESADKTALAVADRIKNNILPSAMGIFNVEIKEEGYIIVTVASGLEKPYYLKKYGMTPNGCYMRIGTQAASMPQSMIDSLFARRVINTLHNVVAPNQHLTFTQLKIFYEEKGMDVSGEHFLRNLDLYTGDGRYNYAAYLLADNNSTSIKVARFNGSEKLDIVERNEFGRCCLIKSALNVLEKLNIANTTVVRVGGTAQRKEIRLIDEEALREAVLNAIIHNDYINGSYPVIEIYDDRMEIISSGGLPVGLSEKEFFESRSLPRNKELMRVFSDVDLCEQLGSGTRKIFRNYPKEVVKISEHFISVVLPYNEEAMSIMAEQRGVKSVSATSPNAPVNEGVNEGVNGGVKLNTTHKAILAVLKKNCELTAQQIADEIGKSKQTVERSIKFLKDNGFIKREGSDKNGSWILLR